MTAINAPDVSVITPTFRREREVVEALQSVLSQQGVSVESIVIDDSPDGSADAAVAQVGDPRVRYVRQAMPSGGRPALVRNHGLGLASGRYISFLDDDDRLMPGALETLVRALDEDPCAGVAFGTVEPFGNDEDVLRAQQAYFRSASSRARSRRRMPALVATLLFQNTVLVNSACVIRRECVSKLGGYDPEISRCEDVEFYMRAIRRFGFVFVDRPVLEYRTGAPSLMHSMVDDGPLRRSYALTHRKYRETHGALEFFALKALAKLLSPS